MRYNMADMLLVFTFIFPLLIACIRKFHIGKIRTGLIEIGKYVALFFAITISFYMISKFELIEKVISMIVVETGNIVNNIEKLPYIVTIVTFVFLVTIIYLILKLVLFIFVKMALNPLLKFINRVQKDKGEWVRRGIAVILALPKSIFYTFLMIVLLNIIGASGLVNNQLEYEVLNSRIHNLVDSDSFIKLVINYNNEVSNAREEAKPTSFSVSNDSNVNNRNVINLYNGVTIEQGVKSNDLIDATARGIVENSKNDREKAKRLYEWIGKNIKYDEVKANNITNNYSGYESGAIPAMTSKTGVCFDYACLYVAMAREVGLKVRVITGNAFSGEIWGPHAWNEVYLEDECKWISVDPTFARAGNYFDNRNFDDTHVKDNSIGEW